MFKFLALILALGLVAVACGEDEQTPTSPEGSETASGDTSLGETTSTTPPEEDPTQTSSEASVVPDEVIVAAAGPVLSINPDGPGQNNLPSVQMFFALYDGLTNFAIPQDPAELEAQLQEGNAGLAEPLLAENIDVSADGTTTTFTLRRGVISNWGNEMTAEDVRWSIEKTLSAGATGQFWLLLGGLTSIDQVEVIDDYTVVLNTPEPDDRLLPGLGSGWVPVYDSTEVLTHATDDDPFGDEWLNQNHAGFGPYELVSFGPGGEQVTIQARDDYWGSQPALARVVQRSVPDVNSRLQLLLSGTAALSNELSSRGIQEAEAADNVEVTNMPTTTGAYLVLTNNEEPWNDPEVRQAIAMAIPYADINDAVFEGTATIWDSLVIPPVPGYTNEFFPGTDLEAARAVLESIDTPLRLSYAEGLAVDEEIAIFVQSSLQQAGLEVQLDKQPRAQFDQDKYGNTGAIDFLVDVIDTPGYFDAAYYAFLFATPDGFTNFMGFQSDEIDALLPQLADPETFDAAAVELQQVAAEQYPIFPIAWTGLDYAHADYLDLDKGVTGNGLLRLQDFTAG